MSSKEFHNWCKLQSLLNTRAVKFLRSLFQKLWYSRFNKTWNNTYGQELVNIIKTKAFKSYFKSQRSLLQMGDIDDWDLQLVKNIFIDSDICGEGKRGDDYRKNMEKLAEIRNQLEHNASKNISDVDFGFNWEKISKILVEMGDSKEQLEELKGSSNLQKMIIAQGQNIQKANEMKLEGNKYFQLKKFTEAITSYTEAINLPDNPFQDLAILHSNRSACYFERYMKDKSKAEDIENALKDAKKSRELNSEWHKSYFRLGKVYVELNKLDKAQKAFERALVLEPNNEEIKMLLNSTKLTKKRQACREHLDPGMRGASEDEWLENFKVRSGIDMKKREFDGLLKFIESQSPGLEDVWKGHDYRDGTRGMKQDYTMAAKYYQKGVDKGNAEAMYNLARLKEDGRGVNKDFAEAFALYKKAAEQPHFDPAFEEQKYYRVGVAESEHALGTWYAEGIYVKQDRLQEVYWYERAVAHGSAWAANNLGLLYMHGRGVEQNFKKAEQLLLLAASRNDYNAPDCLVTLYLMQGIPEKAMKWNKISMEKGSVSAIRRQQYIKFIQYLMQKKLEKLDIIEWEKANNFSSDNLTLKERIERKGAFNVDPQVSNFCENIKKTYSEISIPRAPINPGKKSKYDIHELEKLSHTSETAKRMFGAKVLFVSSFWCLTEILEKAKDISIENQLCKHFISSLAKCYRIEHIVASFPRNLKADARDLAENIISQIQTLSRQKESLSEELTDLDQDARLCFAALNFETPKMVIDLLSESIRRHPHSKGSLVLRGNAYSFEGRHEDALRDYNRALEMEPDNYMIFYYRAVSFRLLNRYSNAVKAYEEYLARAPIDDRKRPEAYYSIGNCTFYEGNKSTASSKKLDVALLKKCQEYFELGLEMEKKQLPFFLPYVSNSKRLLETLVNPQILFEKKEPLPNAEKIKLKDPLRKELIVDQRRCIREWRKEFSENWTTRSNTVNPQKKQKLPKSLTGLKPVYLSEIDFTKDHVLNGYVLEVMVIDLPLDTGRSIMLIVEDKNGGVQSTALYNLDESETDVQELGVGSKFSIINPYIRMAADGKPMIRVDDPSTVIFEEKIKNMCACCGDVPQDPLACGACRKTVYCSEGCQKKDWKEADMYER